MIRSIVNRSVVKGSLTSHSLLPRYCVRSSTSLVSCRWFLDLPFGREQTNHHKVSKVIHQCTQKQIFDVVSSVELYKDFVPFVEESYIKDTKGQTSIAGLKVGWKQFDETFECRVTSVPYESVVAESITISLFSELHTEWRFKPKKSLHGESVTVDLTLKYKFKNPLYNTVSSMFSDQVTSIMIKAFESRVKKLIYEQQQGKKR